MVDNLTVIYVRIPDTTALIKSSIRRVILNFEILQENRDSNSNSSIIIQVDTVHIHAPLAAARHNPSKLGFCARLAQTFIFFCS